MNRFFISVVSVLLFSLIPLNAAVYKGQRVFQKNCLQCHKPGESFIASHTIEYWQKATEQKGRKLAELHLISEKAHGSWEYFRSKKYTKKAKHLGDFLMEYAQDSGNIPACN